MALRGVLHDAAASLAIGILALAAWWIAGRIAWSSQGRKLLAATVAGGALTVSVVVLLEVHGRNLPTAAEYREGLTTVATLFEVGRESHPPWELDDKQVFSDVGDGVSVVRECKTRCPSAWTTTSPEDDERRHAAEVARLTCGADCNMNLRRGTAVSCSIVDATRRVPVLLRRDVKHRLWFFDDGSDLLAYRSSDLKCIDISLRDLLLDLKPSSAWAFGGAAGVMLAVLAQLLARSLAAGPKRAGTEEARVRVSLSLKAFSLAIVFATMPPLASTLLGTLW